MKSKTFRPVIRSMLETDLYKLTMLQPMLHHMASNQAVYRFVCRNTPQLPLARLKDEVEQQLDHLCTLRFQDDELEWLSTYRFFKPDFIEFLRIFQLQRRFIKVDVEGDKLVIEASGPQLHVMLFEIYVLAMVNELHFREFDSEEVREEGRRRLQAKIELLESGLKEAGPRRNPFEFFDFGVRRRFSGDWQEEVVATLAKRVPQYFKGTSNMYLARKYKLTPIGTMAHEYLQTFQTMGVQLRQFQKAALETWVQEYRGDLGIALTDVVGMDAFFADFDGFHGRLFDGLRHDSGDPVEWGEKAISHYQKLRIEPNTKRLVFSDGLGVPTAIELYAHFADRVMTGFGIGTNLTNDLGLKPLNIVMKLVSCNGQPTAKLSDTPGKTMCDDETFLAYLRQVFNVAQPASA